jgi:hypothetical protein
VPARAILFGFCLTLTTLFVVFLVEMMVPVGRKADFTMICSEYLSKMEYLNGLPETEKQQLGQRLASAGFSQVVIAGTSSAKKGDILTLSVQASYTQQGITGLFMTGIRQTEMRYEKSTVARRIFNE